MITLQPAIPSKFDFVSQRQWVNKKHYHTNIRLKHTSLSLWPIYIWFWLAYHSHKHFQTRPNVSLIYLKIFSLDCVFDFAQRFLLVEQATEMCKLAVKLWLCVYLVHLYGGLRIPRKTSRDRLFLQIMPQLANFYKCTTTPSNNWLLYLSSVKTILHAKRHTICNLEELDKLIIITWSLFSQNSFSSAIQLIQ